MAVASNDPVLAISMIDQRAKFEADGFVVVDQLIDPAMCTKLNARLERVLRGQFDVPDGRPDKAPKFSTDLRVKPGKVPPPLGGPSKTTLQLINIWKADQLFREIVTSPTLGRAVAELGGWSAGARVANDQASVTAVGSACALATVLAPTSLLSARVRASARLRAAPLPC